MTDADREAHKVWNRFSAETRYAVQITVRTFAPSVEEADAWQEARMLVLSYAGLIQGRLHGKLAQWEQLETSGDGNVRRLLSAQLCRDLYQIFGRQEDRSLSCMPLETLPPRRIPVTEPEDGWIAAADRDSYVRREYPNLAMSTMDELTEEEIAARTEVTDRTVRNRLAAEKRRASKDPFFIAVSDKELDVHDYYENGDYDTVAEHERISERIYDAQLAKRDAYLERRAGERGAVTYGAEPSDVVKHGNGCWHAGCCSPVFVGGLCWAHYTGASQDEMTLAA